LDQLNN
jgi:DNA-directed RNA polymerase subunit delta